MSIPQALSLIENKMKNGSSERYIDGAEQVESSGSILKAGDHESGCLSKDPVQSGLTIDGNGDGFGHLMVKECAQCKQEKQTNEFSFNLLDDSATAESDDHYVEKKTLPSDKGLLQFVGRTLEHCSSCGLQIHNLYSKKGRDLHLKLNLGGFSPVLVNNIFKTCESKGTDFDCSLVILEAQPRSSAAYAVLDDQTSKCMDDSQDGSHHSLDVFEKRPNENLHPPSRLSGHCSTIYGVSKTPHKDTLHHGNPIQHRTCNLSQFSSMSETSVNSNVKNSLNAAILSSEGEAAHSGRLILPFLLQNQHANTVKPLKGQESSDIVKDSANSMTREKVQFLLRSKFLHNDRNTTSLLEAKQTFATSNEDHKNPNRNRVSLSKSNPEITQSDCFDAHLSNVIEPRSRSESQVSSVIDARPNKRLFAMLEENIVQVPIKKQHLVGSCFENAPRQTEPAQDQLIRHSVILKCANPSVKEAATAEVEVPNSEKTDATGSRSVSPKAASSIFKALSASPKIASKSSYIASSASMLYGVHGNMHASMTAPASDFSAASVVCNKNALKVKVANSTGTAFSNRVPEKQLEITEYAVAHGELKNRKALAIQAVTEGSVSHWSNCEVVHFLKGTDCAEYADIFEEEEIDGQALLLLNEEKLHSLLGIKMGPAIKIARHINSLKPPSSRDLEANKNS